MHLFNLQGNPCCEEPGYRLCTINSLPPLLVLDLHVITPLERERAKALIAGDVVALTVAFGKRVPRYDPSWDEKSPDISPLEAEVHKVCI